MLLLPLATSPIRRLATNPRITTSRMIRSSERPLSSCKQQLCPFACSASLPAPSRAVSTLYLHKRDQRNNANYGCQSKLRTYSTKKPMNHNAELSLELETTYYSYIGSPFLIIFLYPACCLNFSLGIPRSPFASYSHLCCCCRSTLAPRVCPFCGL